MNKRRSTTKRCSVLGCEDFVVQCGMCSRHEQRNRKYGSPLARPQYIRGASDQERFEFWAIGLNPETGCREWMGEREEKMGYGRMFVNEVPGRRIVFAHRWIYEKMVGPIPTGMLVCHHCDNPPCVTVDHLFLGTSKDNRVDCVNKGRHNVAHKLTVEIADLIRARHKEIGSLRLVAVEFEVSKSTVGDVVRGERWT